MAYQPITTPLQTTDYDSEQSYGTGLTALRDKTIAQRYTVLADSIADGLAAFWTSSVTNGGTTAVATGEGLIQTSANAIGTAQLSSTAVTYWPGQVAWLNSAIRLGDTGSAGNVRRWGAFTVSGTTPQNGFYYELNGTTLNAVAVSAGTATAVASTSWTKVATAPFTLDLNYHQFEVRFTSNSVQFYIDNVLRHTQSGGAAAITGTLNFPMTLQSLNTSGATNRVLAVRNIGMGRFGTPDVQAVSLATAPTTPVTGTFWQATQPVSATALPLPTGAAADATLTGGTVRTKITDGTTNVAVKAASTAAAATDPAVVVAVSPNNTVPVSLATNTPTLAAGTAIVGKVGIDQTTPGTTNAVSETHLPAAAALADALAVPTVTQIGADLMAYNGTTMDRLRTVTTMSGAANSTGLLAVGSVLWDGANYRRQLGDTAGNLKVTGNATTNSTGLTILKVLSAASTNGALVLTGARAIYGWHLVNTATTPRYVRFYNKATAPTVGTDSPTFVIPLPGSGGAVLQPNIMNIALSLGFGISITAAAADLDTTATAANDVVGTIWYA